MALKITMIRPIAVHFAISFLCVLLTTGCERPTSEDTTPPPSQPSAQTHIATPESEAHNADTDSPFAAHFPPAPELPPRPDTLRIAVISDINRNYGSIGYSSTVRAAVSDIVRRQFDFVLSPGDLVAGQRHGLNYDLMWKAFHYEVGDVFFDNHMEFIMAPGNHDASAFPQHAEERRAYQLAFKDRKPKAPLLKGSHFPFYYAVSLKDVLIVALDITRPLSDDDPQLDWLETLLLTHQNVRTTLVLGHLPLTPVNLKQFWATAGSTRLLALLRSRPNTIYISGHHHVFYPGHLGELRTLACPALGNNPRTIPGIPPYHGYVQITIPPHSPPQITALVAPDFTRTVDITQLPKNILQLEREDIGMAEYLIELLDASVEK